MRIKNLELTNFGSYKGDANEFNFETNTGRDGYAIFGDIGRGKTSMVNGILWCLYGHVSMRDIVAEKSRQRAIVDAKQQDKEGGKQGEVPPLLNTYAFQDGNYKLSVRIVFEHVGKDGKTREYSLLRLAEPKPKTKKPQNDSHMKLTAHLSVDGKGVSAAIIQDKINEVIHEDISKFFFVEGDVIDSYAHLLFAKDVDHSIVEEVEMVLGLPALDKSEEDFKWLSDQSGSELVNATKDIKKLKRVRNKIEKLDEEINGLMLSINILTQQIDSLSSKKAEIDIELSSEISVATSMEKRKQNLVDIREKGKSLEIIYDDRRDLLSGNLWTCLIQKGLETSLDILEDLAKKKSTIVQQRADEVSKVERLLELVSKGATVCKNCGNKEEGISHEEKKKKSEEISDLKISIEEMEAEIESIGNPNEKHRNLTKFRDTAGFKTLADLENNISLLMIEINTLKKKNKQIGKALEDHDMVHIADLQKQKNDCIERGGALKKLRADDKSKLESRKLERKNNVAKLQDSVDNDQVREISKRKEVYEWFSEQFKGAMKEFKEEARTSVENVATDGFLRMVSEPERYSEVKVDSNWRVVVIDKVGREAILGNPGHRQTLALAVFNGLRKTSKLQFPTFFDNPGSNIADVNKVADYFWEDDLGQMVMLSHAGGLEKDVVMEKYGTRLARSWELTYPDNSDDLISVIEVIN